MCKNVLKLIQIKFTCGIIINDTIYFKKIYEVLFVLWCSSFCPGTFCPSNFEAGSFCPGSFCPYPCGQY